MIEWKEELGTKGLKLNIKKINVMHVGKNEEQFLRIGTSRNMNILVSFLKEGRTDREISNCVRKANSVYYTINNKHRKK